MADRIELDDLFDLTFGSIEHGAKLLPTELHLVSGAYDDDGWTTTPAGTDILTCRRCGSLVPDDSADLHLDWHRKMETKP